MTDVETVESEDVEMYEPGTDVATLRPAEVASVEDIAAQIDKVRQLMERVMVKGIDGDYSVVDGCGNKPILLQPGADKIRALFNLSVQTERTMFEPIGACAETGHTKYVVAYRTRVYDIHGRCVGDMEAVASHDEATFVERKWENRRPVGIKGYAPLNTLFKRAQKRSRVGAIANATAVRDLFTSGGETPATISEAQASVLIACAANLSPQQAAVIEAKASTYRTADWETYLGAAVDALQATYGWSTRAAQRLFKQLDAPGVTGEVATELIAKTLDAEGAGA